MTPLRWIGRSLLVVTLGLGGAGASADDRLSGFGMDALDDDIGDALGELVEDLTPCDFDLLRNSYLTYIRYWDGVKPARLRKGAPEPESGWAWRELQDDAAPLQDRPISALIEVPASGSYRVYLRYSLDKKLTGRAVQVSITPQKAQTGADETVTYSAAGAPVPTSAWTNWRVMRCTPLLPEHR